MKNRLSLTIDADLLVKAKKFASDSGVSLSSLVEDCLSRAIYKNESIDVDGILSDFHKRAFKKISKKLSDSKRDVKGFKNSPIKVRNPRQFLRGT